MNESLRSIKDKTFQKDSINPSSEQGITSQRKTFIEAVFFEALGLNGDELNEFINNNSGDIRDFIKKNKKSSDQEILDGLLRKFNKPNKVGQVGIDSINEIWQSTVGKRIH